VVVLRSFLALVFLAVIAVVSAQAASGTTDNIAATIRRAADAPSYEVSVRRHGVPGEIVYTHVAPNEERSWDRGAHPTASEQIVVDNMWFVETSPGSGIFALNSSTPPPANAPLLLRTLANSVHGAKRLGKKNGEQEYSVMIAATPILALKRPASGILTTRNGVLYRVCIRGSTRTPACRFDIVVTKVGDAGPVHAPKPSSVVLELTRFGGHLILA
jgi:hypothetical protein